MWVLLEREVYEEFMGPVPDDWVPWEEAWRSNKQENPPDGKNYRCSICHTYTGGTWTMNCPNELTIEHAVVLAIKEEEET